ncbi:flavin reductase family protein [Streptomyces odontomachi]|uniref:flavin reductase family protein n=1 Tax=Streptomyces odontomachi TaxID=2944940 RepID=UPI00210D950D|nr:flavin reductase family protein [Streptomyces sp. ODS25]
MTASPDLGSAPFPTSGSLDTPELLRAVFRRHAAGVAVITAGGEVPVGFTATSLTSVSLDPPLLSFGIGLTASSWPAVSRATHVGVHILGEHQHEVAATFARSGADRFGPPTRWRPGTGGVPILGDVPAWLVCRVVARVPAGDHRIVLAEPVDGDATGVGRPLLYHEGGFRVLRDQ